MTNLYDFEITGLRNLTYSEAASVGVVPHGGIVIVCKKDSEVIFLSPFYQSRKDNQFKPMSFFIIEKESMFPSSLASLNVANSTDHSVISDGEESDPVRWLEKDSECNEIQLIEKKIVDYGNYPVAIFEDKYDKFFNKFNRPSLLFCESVSLINLSGDIDLVACAHWGSAIENSKFYILGKKDGAITSLIDVFNKSSIRINHI